MASPALDVLVLSDLHYVREADHVPAIKERDTTLGLVLLHGDFSRLREQGVEVGLVVILGDVVDNGLADGAEVDLAAVAYEARRSGLPTLAVPGNHDGHFERFSCIFGCGPGMHEIGGYGFLLFHDRVGKEDVTTRPPEGLQLLGMVASEHPKLPLVALQHNPLHPDIESDYPYMLTNRREVLSGYGETGVILSLSGHYHAGQPAHRVDSVIYCTVPAICEPPFRFAHVRLEGRRVKMKELALGDRVNRSVNV
jgi:predicted MPP superfamily phosphohydrolase